MKKGSKHTIEAIMKMTKHNPHNRPWLGKKRIFSEKHKKNLSNAMKKVDISKMIKARWSGHIKTTKEYKHFKNKKYKEWRKTVFKRDGYLCKDCGIKGDQVEGYLEAHHIKGYTYYKELRYEIANGITLCRKCHLKRHKVAGVKS